MVLTIPELKRRIEIIECNLFRKEPIVMKIDYTRANISMHDIMLKFARKLGFRVIKIEKQLSILITASEYRTCIETYKLYEYLSLLSVRIERAEMKLFGYGFSSEKEVTVITSNKTDKVTSSDKTGHCPIVNSKILEQKKIGEKCEKSVSQISNSSSVNFQCPNFLEELSNDFYSMFSQGIFADISIKCGSEVLKAHKNVLYARSSVFEAMFSTPMQESAMDSMVIDDIESGILRTMLTFMYSGQVKDLDASMACDLLYAAEKYQIKGLKQVCVQYLKSHISVDNAFHILHWGDLYDEQLRTTGLTFISQHFSILKETDEWHDFQLSHSPLALKIYACVVEILQNGK